MSDITYACTVLKTLDRDNKPITYQAGDVIRLLTLSGLASDAWSDCIILGFSDPKRSGGSVFVKLARPYAYASCIGTTGPGILVGTEDFTMEAVKLVHHLVVSSHPMVSGSVEPIKRGYDSEVIDLNKKVARAAELVIDTYTAHTAAHTAAIRDVLLPYVKSPECITITGDGTVRARFDCEQDARCGSDAVYDNQAAGNILFWRAAILDAE